MELLTFIVEMSKALGWPIAAILIMIALRRQIVRLLPFVRKVKAGPFEVELFEREVERVFEEVSGPTLAPSIEYAVNWDHNLETLIRTDWRSAILKAWLDVEVAAKRAALQRIATSPAPDVSSPLRAMRMLLKYELISPEDFELFLDLRGLRNQAAHVAEWQPSRDAILRYLDLAARLEARLERLATPDH